MPPTPRPLRIAVVNDVEMVVNGIARMLLPYADRVVVVELDNRLPVTTDVDLILFDSFADRREAGTGLPQLIQPDGPKVAVFTWTFDDASIDDALAQGVVGYLSKALPAPDLLAALEDIATGALVVSAPDKRALGPGFGDWPGREVGLSPRESEVLALIAQGLTNQRIADAMYLSINSVKTYIRTAYRKIGVLRRSQAVGWALHNGFADAPRRSFPDR